MLSLLRGVALGALLLGVGLLAAPNHVEAQAKKDDKKDDKKDAKNFGGKVTIDDTIREKKLSFPTSDRIALQAYWFPATKNTADAVIMFPAPGKKINDGWIALAKTLSEQEFSVLLFDWRGCGLNGPDRNIRIFDDDKEFKKDSFNVKYAPRNADKVGLDYNLFTARYRDFLMNDLQAARFFLDKQNDDQKCNTNRIWIVSEGAGAQMGLAFIAAESYRFSLFKGSNILDQQDPRKAVKDYAGLVSLSYSATSPTAAGVYQTVFVNRGSSADGKEGKTHVENRLAMVMLYGKKEGPSASRSIVNQFITGNEDALKLRFKYFRELDNSKAAKPISAGDFLTPMDDFGARDLAIKAMIEISKDKQDFGKERTKRNAAEITTVPRFPIESYKPN